MGQAWRDLQSVSISNIYFGVCKLIWDSLVTLFGRLSWEYAKLIAGWHKVYPRAAQTA